MRAVKIIPNTCRDRRRGHIVDIVFYMHERTIGISLSPVTFELYDRPRALCRKLAKSFGCPGKKGRSRDRSMVLSVSVSVLEAYEEVR